MKTRKKYRSIKKRKFKMNYMDLIIVLLIVIMIVIGILFINLGLDFEKNIKPIYSYTVERDDDYQVLLKPNDYYTSETLPSGKYYAAKSIQEYILDFKYHFYGDRESDIEYDYNITAELVGIVNGSDNDGKEVWNRTFDILEDKHQNEKNEFYINEKINIDYEYYNNLARSYEKEYGISIDSSLKIYLNISYIIDNIGEDIDKTQDRIELDIPITNTVTHVQEKYEKLSNQNIIPKIEDLLAKKAVYYLIGGICIIVAIVIILIKVRIIKHNRTPQDVYEKNINKILKYYRDLIVTVKDEPDISNFKIMNVMTMDDLLDVAEQNKANIIHYQVIKAKISKLYVIVDDYVYVYHVTANEMK